MGKRETNRLRRRGAIYTAALAQFDRRGYDGTTMAGIARQARLGVGTLYNHFDSKADLLRSLLAAQTEEAVVAAERLLAAPVDSPRQAVLALAQHYLGLLYSFRKDLWREVLALGLARGLMVQGGLLGLDQALRDQLRRLLGRLVVAGQLASGFDSAAAADLLYAAFMVQFLAFVHSPAHVTDEQQAALAAQVAVLLPA